MATFQDLLAWARDLLRDSQRPTRLSDVSADLRRRVPGHRSAPGRDRLFPGRRRSDGLPCRTGEIRGAGETVPGGRSQAEHLSLPSRRYHDLRRPARSSQGHSAHLVQNFRSVAGAGLGQPPLRQPHAARRVQPEYVALAARWAALEESSPSGVYRVGGQITGTPVNAALVEAEAFASVARIGREYGWRLRASRADERIVRRLTTRRLHPVAGPHVPARLERALEVARRCRSVEAGKLVLATQEVRDLLAVCGRSRIPPTRSRWWRLAFAYAVRSTCCIGSRAAAGSTTNTLAMAPTGRGARLEPG